MCCATTATCRATSADKLSVGPRKASNFATPCGIATFLPTVIMTMPINHDRSKSHAALQFIQDGRHWSRKGHSAAAIRQMSSLDSLCPHT